MRQGNSIHVLAEKGAQKQVRERETPPRMDHREEIHFHLAAMVPGMRSASCESGDAAKQAADYSWLVV
jgi:hypothetical protein